VLIRPEPEIQYARIFNEALGVNVRRAKACCASLRAVSYAARSSSCLRTTRMPATAAAATAFKISGKPIFAASLASCSSPSIAPSLPGIVAGLRFSLHGARGPFRPSFHYFRARANKRNFRRFANFWRNWRFRKEIRNPDEWRQHLVISAALIT